MGHVNTMSDNKSLCADAASDAISGLDMCRHAYADQDAFYASCRTTLLEAEKREEDLGSVFADLITVFTDRPDNQWHVLRDEVLSLHTVDILDALFSSMRYRHHYIKSRKRRLIDIITGREYYISISIRVADSRVNLYKNKLESCVQVLKRVYQSMESSEFDSIQYSVVMEIACSAMRDHLAESLAITNDHGIHTARYVRMQKRYADFLMLLEAMKSTQNSYAEQKRYIVFMIDELRRVLDIFIPFCDESIKISNLLKGSKAKKFYNEFIKILNDESRKAKKENDRISHI